MRLLILSSLALVAVRCPEQKIPPIPPPKGIEVTGAVEVTNLPKVQDVRVVEAPEALGPPRFQVVGFTDETHPGDLGGFVGAARKCQIDFPDSRICWAWELQETTRLPDAIPEVAWGKGGGDCDPAKTSFPDGQEPMEYDGPWTSASEYARGAVMHANGALGGESCDEALPIACCALVR